MTEIIKDLIFQYDAPLFNLKEEKENKKTLILWNRAVPSAVCLDFYIILWKSQGGQTADIKLFNLWHFMKYVVLKLKRLFCFSSILCFVCFVLMKQVVHMSRELFI